MPTQENWLGGKQKSSGHGERSSKLYPYAAFGERISGKTFGRYTYVASGQGQGFLLRSQSGSFSGTAAVPLSSWSVQVCSGASGTIWTPWDQWRSQPAAALSNLSPKQQQGWDTCPCSSLGSEQHLGPTPARWWQLTLGLTLAFMKGCHLPMITSSQVQDGCRQDLSSES